MWEFDARLIYFRKAGVVEGERGLPQRRRRTRFDNRPTPAKARASTVRHGHPVIRAVLIGLRSGFTMCAKEWKATTGTETIAREPLVHGNGPPMGIIQGATIERGIDAGLGHSAPEIGSKPWGLGSPPHACHSY